MTPERLAECSHEPLRNKPYCHDCGKWARDIIRDLEAPPKCARGCDRDGVGSPCIHELSPDELTGVASHIRDLEAQLATAREALGRIAFEDEVVYLGCADLPFCQRTHDEHCPVRIARDALATATPPSLSAKERQRRSFAYGNVHIDNPNVTREMVDRAAERLASEPPSPEVGE